MLFSSKYISIIGWILFTAVSFQILNHLFWIGDYVIRYETYQKNCVNREKLASSCKGSCQLMKNLQSTNQQDEQASFPQKNHIEQVLSSKSFFINTVNHSLTFLFHEMKYRDPFVLPIIRKEIDHPPQA
ncbi:MAG: hypothetical protein MUF12_08280 [Sediminibacterium sp.]|jgi:hypothetical protein|nr:hypothetical protein [Sediminibacterium sp.]